MAIRLNSNKYGAKQAIVDGYTFASQREANRYRELRLLQKAGVITNLELQKRYSIKVNGVHVCDYISDFEYDENGKHVVEDSKGVRTPVYKLKRRLVEAVYNVHILET